MRWRVTWWSSKVTRRGVAEHTEHKHFDTAEGARRFFERLCSSGQAERARLVPVDEQGRRRIMPATW